MPVNRKPLCEINQKAIAALSREIGIADTIRFINQFTLGHGDYTEERRHLSEEMSLDEIVTAIRGRRNL